jgi:F0F1-type ATP synthase delta subunit
VAVELTLIQTRKVYNIREQYKTKYIQKNKVHTVQIQTCFSITDAILNKLKVQLMYRKQETQVKSSLKHNAPNGKSRSDLQ